MKLKHKTIVLDDGFRVGVSQVGTGVPLVFLHGLTVSALAYEELLIELAQRGFAVTALDAVNHGRTDSLPFGHTVEEMTRVTLRALDALGIDKAVFVGHSMGGGMVTEIAPRYPERVLAAVLLDAAAGKEHHANLKDPLRATQRLSGAVVDVFGDTYQAIKLRSATEGLGLAQTLRSSFAGFRFVRAAYALLKADTEPLLKAMKALDVQTAVIHGLSDQIVPFAAGKSAAASSGSALYAVEGFHSWMLADPELAAEVIVFALLGFYPQRYLLGAG
ncbi:hydrolase [Mycobacterium phage PotatoSplit]|uniref:Hydrolase n=1 Tax=Mycobacterium phage PotatoSplit TaxID=2499052 RepID=A0A3S9URP7_9CAUD|nr:hydrolase [Mycobacterium phage PotatoSplit]